MRNKVNRNSSENWSISVCARVHHCTKPRAKSQMKYIHNKSDIELVII